MIAVCPNPYRDIDLQLTKKIVELLKNNGKEVCICQIFTDIKPQLEDVRQDLEIAIIIGGDGTILSAVKSLDGCNVPILGINLGTMGFMTSIGPENYEYVLKAINGDYRKDIRMMLDVELIRDGKSVYEGCCLNDAVIHGSGDTISIDVKTNGANIIRFDGDGVIISTPTGSTGYSMSAGGPIVEPEARAIVLSPICAHTLRSRTYVLARERLVSIQTSKLHDRKAYLSVDGNSVVNLINGDLLKVRESENVVTFVDFGIKSFYDTAFEKLS